MTAIGDLHWRACCDCEHARDGKTFEECCVIDDEEMRKNLIIDSPELKCGCFKEKSKKEE